MGNSIRRPIVHFKAAEGPFNAPKTPSNRDDFTKLELVLAKWLTTYAPAAKRALTECLVQTLTVAPTHKKNNYPIHIETIAGTIILEENLNLDITVGDLKKRLRKKGMSTNTLDIFQHSHYKKPLKDTDTLRSLLQKTNGPKRGAISQEPLTLVVVPIIAMPSSLDIKILWKEIAERLNENNIMVAGKEVNLDELHTWDKHEANNLFNTWMESRDDLDSIKRLFLGITNITSLPQSIRSLQNLKVLYLYSTNITSLPDWIGNLENLETLGLSNAKITSLPDFIGGLKHLKRVDLSFTNITSLPDSIGDLKNLDTLDIIGCKSLDKRARRIISLLRQKGVKVSG
jgi:Leucine-rich repeat (LRR) protein